MRVIALAIVGIGAVAVMASAYLWRYEVIAGGSSASYRLHDRWTHRMTYCVRIESKGTQPPDLDCTSWGPLVGGQP